MECNKEEAIRAKEIAEKKMQNKDFAGARKIALKAQLLYPDLENISQMLTVCDVHCSAEQKLFGSEMNWYGILQVGQTADEASIKKQYRKLALLLHPDKNKFGGAEAAFKLIGEAQRVLSDQQKRVMYDMKYKSSQRTTAPKQPLRQANRSSQIRNQPGIQTNFGTQFTNPQQQTQPGFHNGQHTFWTVCPHCGIKYQYYRNIMQRSLRCQSCTNPFIAIDIDAQGAPMGASWNHSVFPQQKEVPGQGAHKVGQQSNIGNPPSSMGFQGNFGSGFPASQRFPKTGSTSEVGGDSKAKGKEDGDIEEGINRSQTDPAKREELKHSGNSSRKRGRISEEESSESCDTGSSAETEEDAVIEEDGVLPAGQNFGATGGRYPRRSTRQKTNVTYKEDLSDDDDYASPPKRSRESESFSSTEEQSEETSSKGEASGTDKEKVTPLEESLPNGNDEAVKCEANGKEATAEDDSVRRSNVDDGSKENLGPKTLPDPEFYEYPDPDFHDFDKDRKKECFAIDQFWAIYDNTDGMPRFYARIKKVFSSGFKLRITWLEPDPDDQDEIDWTLEELPVACGKFKHGKTEDTEDLLMFSHLTSWEKGSSRGSYMIYPRKGETWALFRNWDIKWNSDPDNHRKYEFEFVEVLSDYVEDAGIRVAYLGKVKGFVSLFRQMTKKGMVSVQITPHELFRFSHRVPSFRMTGRERADVPEGSFELDPASLPMKLEEFAYPEDVEMDVEYRGSCPKSVGENVKPMMESRRPNTQKNSTDLDEKNTLARGNLKSGNWSQMEQNGTHKKPSQANASECDDKDKTDKPLDGMEGIKDPNSSQLLSPEPDESPGTEFYDFEADKSFEKFETGQIWALYSDADGMPKYYAQIKKIVSSPDYKLYITWLDACPPPKDRIQWLDKDIPVSCGVFKLGNAHKDYNETCSFSHRISAESTGRNRFDIHPRKGEVWAMYKSWNAEWTCSDLPNCKYDIVEVLEDNGSRIKVQVLVKVGGYKSVFKAEKKGGSAVTLEISKMELLRFSHQIPAFHLTKERDGSLRGCWELDSQSMPSP